MRRELLRTQGLESLDSCPSFITICRWIGDRGKHLPRDRLDSGDLSWVQQSICGTAECSSDIEGDDELSRKPRVGGAGYIHDGSKGKATGIEIAP